MNRINVVWNVTRLCPFACSFCCVSAIRTKGFRQINPLNDDTPVVEGELSFNQQVAVLDQMKADDFKVDFSGGDVLINPRNVDLIVQASEKFGQENIGLSIPGTFISPEVLEKLSGKVSDIEITLDNIPSRKDKHRPLNYGSIAVKGVKKLVDAGFYVGVQTVLRCGNMSPETLKKLLLLIESLGVRKWSLLKLSPVGRLHNRSDIIPEDREYARATEFIEKICARSGVRPHFQYLMPNHNRNSFRCRAVRDSIGITPSGKVSACFWALQSDGEPFDDVVLGKVPEQNIYKILKSEKSCKWESFGDRPNYCGIEKILNGEE